MTRRICMLVITFIAIMAITGCSMKTNDTIDSPDWSNIIEDLSGYMKQYEAANWLENSKNPYAFAGNRFEDTASAMAFVRTLYDRGAKQVLVSGILDEPWRIEEEGGPYADILIVTMPSDKAQRDQILEIYRMECRDYFCNDGDEESGIRGDTLTFWWD